MTLNHLLILLAFRRFDLGSHSAISDIACDISMLTSIAALRYTSAVNNRTIVQFDMMTSEVNNIHSFIDALVGIYY